MGTVSVPAPIGGWNARDPLDAMPPTDAISLINWFPQAGAVYGRGGSLTKCTIGSSPIETLVTFTSTLLTQLIAGTNGKLYTVDPVAGTSAQIGTGFTSNRWQTGHYNNSQVFVNGADLPQVWDGTTLSNFVGSLGIPTNVTVVGSTAGGTIAAGTHAYRVSHTYALSTETTATTEITVVNTGATSSNKVSWTNAGNITGTKVYGRTSAGELLMVTLGPTVTTWTDDGSITPAGALPASDTSTKNLVGTMNMKGRAFYWANAAAGFWYAIAGGFQGTLSYFPMEFVFHRGGYIMQIVSWSRDNGDGVDDLSAFISSNGEMLVYQGTDPSNALTWSMVGRFHVGVPLSVRSHGKVGSKEIIITSEGFASADEAIVVQETQESITFGGKITRAASAAVQQYGANFGWEGVYYPRQQMYLINVPITSTQSEQYVRNTDTGAWCRITGWNALCFDVYKNRLYFGDAVGDIVLADTDSLDTTYGWGDNGVAVLRDCTQAYVRLSNPGMKSMITGVQIVSNCQTPTKASVNFFQDYGFRNLPQVSPADTYGTTFWDTSRWDTFYWGDPTIDPANLNAKPVMYPVRGYGFSVALSYRLSFKLAPVVWYSTNYLFKQAGV